MFDDSDLEIGTRPGTLVIPDDAPATRIFVHQYDADSVEMSELSDPAELEPWFQAGRKIWVDVQGFGNEEAIRGFASVFGLHPVALESAINGPQRAKTELYQNHQLVIARAPRISDAGELEAPQVCFIIGQRFLLTFQERSYGFFEPVRDRLRDGLGPMRSQGPDYLAYALIDTMIDHYYPVAQRLSEDLEELEDFIVENPHPDVLLRIQWLRRQLVVLRRVGRPQREAVAALTRDGSPFIGDKERVYLRDTYDHIAQIVELIDSSREMASDLADAYLSNVSHRTNEIMKVLTLMASIFIPLTFIAGIYGMNFEYIPELKVRNGYFFVWGIMLLLAIGMTILFRRQGWIGTAPPPPMKSGWEE